MAKMKKEKIKTSKAKKEKISKTLNESLQQESTSNIPEDNTSKTYNIAETVFVGNLPSNVKRLKLKKLFSRYGEVKSIRFRTVDGKKIFKNKDLKQLETINAYIIMDSIKSVEKAKELNGILIKSQHIRVNSAEFDNESVDSRKIIFVGNLKYSATNEELHKIFSSCGEIEYVRALQSDKGCKGVAYICFKNPESVGLALELNKTLLDDRPIRVERYSKKKIKNIKVPNKNESKLKASNPMKKENNIKKNKRNLEKNKKLTIKNKTDEKPAKSKFKGIKLKDKKKPKKKKAIFQQLAKKIAPRK